jgi:hypothetical protein
LSGVAISVPPRRLFALASDETLTSIVWPGCANAGSCAVTITVARFFSCMLVPGGTVTPICCSIASKLWIANGACVVWSPVPSRPTTRP